MKQLLANFGIFLLGSIVSIIAVYISISYSSRTEYHIQLLDYDQVELRDKDHNLIKTTTLDSLSYYLIQDNI